ncbi:hypothetical protein [Nodosilinea sp. P-1105]|nr:hypothetical protein [Nodosilinea sp. P-1105]
MKTDFDQGDRPPMTITDCLSRPSTHESHCNPAHQLRFGSFVAGWRLFP